MQSVQNATQYKCQIQRIPNVCVITKKKSGVAVFGLGHNYRQSGTVNKSHMGSQQVAC